MEVENANSDLHPTLPNQLSSNTPPSKATLLKGSETKVLARKDENAQRYYLVQWEGTAANAATWEPSNQLHDIIEKIIDFEVEGRLWSEQDKAELNHKRHTNEHLSDEEEPRKFIKDVHKHYQARNNSHSKTTVFESALENRHNKIHKLCIFNEVKQEPELESEPKPDAIVDQVRPRNTSETLPFQDLMNIKPMIPSNKENEKLQSKTFETITQVQYVQKIQLENLAPSQVNLEPTLLQPKTWKTTSQTQDSPTVQQEDPKISEDQTNNIQQQPETREAMTQTSDKNIFISENFNMEKIKQHYSHLEMMSKKSGDVFALLTMKSSSAPPATTFKRWVESPQPSEVKEIKVLSQSDSLNYNEEEEALSDFSSSQERKSTKNIAPVPLKRGRGRPRKIDQKMTQNNLQKTTKTPKPFLILKTPMKRAQTNRSPALSKNGKRLGRPPKSDNQIQKKPEGRPSQPRTELDSEVVQVKRPRGRPRKFPSLEKVTVKKSARGRPKKDKIESEESETEESISEEEEESSESEDSETEKEESTSEKEASDYDLQDSEGEKGDIEIEIHEGDFVKDKWILEESDEEDKTKIKRGRGRPRKLFLSNPEILEEKTKYEWISAKSEEGDEDEKKITIEMDKVPKRGRGRPRKTIQEKIQDQNQAKWISADQEKSNQENDEMEQEKPKRGRGRPKKLLSSNLKTNNSLIISENTKRKRGRPKKVPLDNLDEKKHEIGENDEHFEEIVILQALVSETDE